jgi:hypothetical protein
MKTTIAAGPPFVVPQSSTSDSRVFGATPNEQAVLRDLREAAAHARAAMQALALARAK